MEKYKSIFISDVHLGSKGCKSKYLYNFLKTHSCENLFLVGDIIDCWRLKSKIYWPQEHSNVIRNILSMAKNGTKVTYITGNHDDFLSHPYFCPTRFLKYSLCFPRSQRGGPQTWIAGRTPRTSGGWFHHTTATTHSWRRIGAPGASPPSQRGCVGRGCERPATTAARLKEGRRGVF